MVIADAGFLQRIWTFLRKGPEAVESKEHDNQAQIKQAAPTSLRRRFIVRSTEDLQSESPHDNDDQHYYYHLLNVTVPLEQDSPAFLAALADGYFPRYRMVLPRRSKILVLDLDETLVHSTSMSSGSGDCDFMVEVLIEKSSCLYYVYKRPYLDHFLETVHLLRCISIMLSVRCQIGFISSSIRPVCGNMPIRSSIGWTADDRSFERGSLDRPVWSMRVST